MYLPKITIIDIISFKCSFLPDNDGFTKKDALDVRMNLEAL